jgi:hypothetical protein
VYTLTAPLRDDLLDAAKGAERPFPRAVSRVGRIGTCRVERRVGARLSSGLPPTPARPPAADLSQQRIKRRAILGGVIYEYQRAA